MINIIKGDLIKLAQQGQFDVIAHGCNCMCIMGAGIAPLMAKAFACDTFKLEGNRHKADINKLGQIDYETMSIAEGHDMKDGYRGPVTIVNAYTQYAPGEPDPITRIPLSYNALKLCFQKMNKLFAGKRIGIPYIGCGLAGGDKETVEAIAELYLSDCDVTIVEFQN